MGAWYHVVAVEDGWIDHTRWEQSGVHREVLLSSRPVVCCKAHRVCCVAPTRIAERQFACLPFPGVLTAYRTAICELMPLAVVRKRFGIFDIAELIERATRVTA